MHLTFRFITTLFAPFLLSSNILDSKQPTASTSDFEAESPLPALHREDKPISASSSATNAISTTVIVPSTTLGKNNAAPRPAQAIKALEGRLKGFHKWTSKKQRHRSNTVTTSNNLNMNTQGDSQSDSDKNFLDQDFEKDMQEELEAAQRVFIASSSSSRSEQMKIQVQSTRASSAAHNGKHFDYSQAREEVQKGVDLFGDDSTNTPNADIEPTFPQSQTFSRSAAIEGRAIKPLPSRRLTQPSVVVISAPPQPSAGPIVQPFAPVVVVSPPGQPSSQPLLLPLHIPAPSPSQIIPGSVSLGDALNFGKASSRSDSKWTYSSESVSLPVSAPPPTYPSSIRPLDSIFPTSSVRDEVLPLPSSRPASRVLDTAYKRSSAPASSSRPSNPHDRSKMTSPAPSPSKSNAGEPQLGVDMDMDLGQQKGTGKERDFTGSSFDVSPKFKESSTAPAVPMDVDCKNTDTGIQYEGSKIKTDTISTTSSTDINTLKVDSDIGASPTEVSMEEGRVSHPRLEIPGQEPHDRAEAEPDVYPTKAARTTPSTVVSSSMPCSATVKLAVTSYTKYVGSSSTPGATGGLEESTSSVRLFRADAEPSGLPPTGVPFAGSEEPAASLLSETSEKRDAPMDDGLHDIDAEGDEEEDNDMELIITCGIPPPVSKQSNQVPVTQEILNPSSTPTDSPSLVICSPPRSPRTSPYSRSRSPSKGSEVISTLEEFLAAVSPSSYSTTHASLPPQDAPGSRLDPSLPAPSPYAFTPADIPLPASPEIIYCDIGKELVDEAKDNARTTHANENGTDDNTEKQVLQTVAKISPLSYETTVTDNGSATQPQARDATEQVAQPPAESGSDRSIPTQSVASTVTRPAPSFNPAVPRYGPTPASHDTLRKPQETVCLPQSTQSSDAPEAGEAKVQPTIEDWETFFRSLPRFVEDIPRADLESYRQRLKKLYYTRICHLYHPRYIDAVVYDFDVYTKDAWNTQCDSDIEMLDPDHVLAGLKYFPICDDDDDVMADP